MQGHGLYHHWNNIRIYFHQVQQLNTEENTIFQRNEYPDLHALALTQYFRKSPGQYIYLRSFLESLVEQLLCYTREIDAADSFHLYPIAFWLFHILFFFFLFRKWVCLYFKHIVANFLCRCIQENYLMYWEVHYLKILRQNNAC